MLLYALFSIEYAAVRVQPVSAFYMLLSEYSPSLLYTVSLPTSGLYPHAIILYVPGMLYHMVFAECIIIS